MDSKTLSKTSDRVEKVETNFKMGLIQKLDTNEIPQIVEEITKLASN